MFKISCSFTLLISLFLQSCSSNYYLPTDGNLMHVVKKGEANIAFSPIDLQRAKWFEQLSVQAAYSPVNKLSFYGQINRWQTYDEKYGELLQTKSFNGELGIGTYFTKQLRSKRNKDLLPLEDAPFRISLDLIAGIGKGQFYGHHYSSLESKVFTLETFSNRFFFQVGNHYDLKRIRFSMGLRTIMKNISKILPSNEAVETRFELDRLETNNPLLFIEASTRLQIGFQKFRLFSATSFAYEYKTENSKWPSFKINKYNHVNSSIFLAGIELSLDKILKKKKRKRI